MAVEGNITVINDGSSNVNTNGTIRLLENKINDLTVEIALIKEKINNINALINENGSSGSNIIRQSYETFNWIKNNIDEFWFDMNGEAKQNVVTCFETLCNQERGPIAHVTNFATKVIEEANKKIEELENEIQGLRDEISWLEAKINNSSWSTGGRVNSIDEQTYKIN